MIQGIANFQSYLVSGLKWIVIWATVTCLIVGAITSVSWARLAYNKYDWTFRIVKQVSEE
jgi:hypothetical protein